MKVNIGYFADGFWACEAFKYFIKDESIIIKFICLRYDRRDENLYNYAKQYNIPVLAERNVNSEEFIKQISKFNVDLFVSMSFNQIFKNEIINLPPFKTINCHAGKLPFYRGRNILNWVLINDEKDFGITVHYVDEGIDTGDIILQKIYPITDADDYSTLLDKAYKGCAEVLYESIKMIQSNQVERITQNSIDSVGMYCGMRRLGDEIIDWNQSSREIFNFVRALCDPGPQAASFICGKKIKINKVKMVDGAHNYKNINGMVLGKTDRGFYVKTGDTMIEVLEYCYGGNIKIGDRLNKEGG